MKPKYLTFFLILFLLQSCIVKSLNPFYIKDKMTSEKRLNGNWKSKSGLWSFTTFEESMKKDSLYSTSIDKNGNIIQDSLNIDERRILNTYKNSFLVEFDKKDNLAIFIATPFIVNGKVLLDFMPFDYETDKINSLAAQHLLKTHSVCMLEFFDEESVQLKWLEQDIIEDLITQQKLKIRHEVTGLDEDLILTATSKELYRFLQKFISSENIDKWNTEQTYTLKRVDAEN